VFVGKMKVPRGHATALAAVECLSIDFAYFLFKDKKIGSQLSHLKNGTES
jgi:hypothetical protein